MDTFNDSDCDYKFNLSQRLSSCFRALYLPLLFKIVQLQLNLSKGLVDDVSAQTFIKSNQSGVIISVICCLAITGILIYTLNDFIAGLLAF